MSGQALCYRGNLATHLGGFRVITFSNGTVTREEFVSADDATRRLVYAICGNERLKHYQGAAQVFADGEKRCHFVWTVDVLPDAMAGYIIGGGAGSRCC